MAKDESDSSQLHTLQDAVEQARRRALKAQARVESAFELAVQAGVPQEMLTD